MDVLDRLADKFTVGDDCWEWTAGKSGGYGRFWDGTRMVLAHRFMYELLVGPIPEELEPDHLCRNRGCVRPAHLEPVTRLENVLRGEGRNNGNENAGAFQRAKTHCPRGHPYRGANLKIAKSGQRVCRTCAIAATRRWREER